MSSNKRNRLRAWARYDGTGEIIPGSIQLRPLNVIMRDGDWKQLVPANLCCAPASSFILFRNTTASANITAISTADGAINWTGTLANAGYLIFQIPGSYNETFSVTVSSFSGRTLTNSTTLGDGTISAVGSLAALTTTFTTSSDTGSQYLSILS